MIEYLRDFNATQAALRSGYSPKTAYSIGQENLKKPDIADAIKAILDERSMGADEIVTTLTEQGRADIGKFFKIVEEWTAYPLPTYEVIDAKERVVDEKTGEKKTFYWVRHVCIDLDKLVNSEHSKLVKKFSDSPKDGLTIELYDKQRAIVELAKLRGMYVNRTEITGKDGNALSLETFTRAVDKVYGGD